MKRISKQIALAIIGCCLVLSILLAAVSSWLSRQYIYQEANEKLLHMSSNYANAFGIEISHVENTVDILKNTIDVTFDMTEFRKNPKEYVDKYNKFITPIIQVNAEHVDDLQGIYFTPNPFITGAWQEVWIADTEGGGTYRQVDMNITDLSVFNDQNPLFGYYFKSIKNRKPIWLDPYIDETINVYMISYVVPIIKEGSVIGIIGSDMKIGDIADTIKKMKIYNTGFGMLINDKDEVIIHPDLATVEPLKAMLGGSYATVDLRKDGTQSEIKKIAYMGKDALLSYAQLPNGWIMAIQAPESEVLSRAEQLTKILGLIGFIGIVMAAGVAIILARILEKLIDQNASRVTKAQYQLAESERIAALTYLVSGVAHEINTPVGNSITLTTFIEEEAQKSFNQIENNTIKRQQLLGTLMEVQESSKQIYKNLNETQQIINDFKDLAAIKTSGIVEYFDTVESIQEAFENVMNLTEHSQVDLDIQGDKTVKLFGDVKLYSQIFYHLIGNSVLHGFENRPKGKITIWIKPIPNGIELKYTDDGIGLTEELINRIYVPFFSTKFSNKNKGLGMNVVYNIVRGAFSGSITIESPNHSGIMIQMTLHNFSRMPDSLKTFKMH